MTLYAMFILVGATNMVFSYPNITIEGNTSSFDAANQACSDKGTRLLSTENDELTYFTDFLKDNNLNSAWLNARLKKLSQWTFTDEKNTQLKEIIEQSNDREMCGAISNGKKFKAFPCNKSLHALKQNEKGELFAYNGSTTYKWHTLNKSILATPTSKPFEKHAAFSKRSIAAGYPTPIDSLVGLRKFDFSWQHKLESAIPLRGNNWDDNSVNNGECLLLSSTGNFVVVDCESDHSYPVLCIPADPYADPYTDPSADYKDKLKTALIVLGVICIMLAILSICVVWYNPKCKLVNTSDLTMCKGGFRGEKKTKKNEENIYTEISLQTTQASSVILSSHGERNL